MTGLVKYEAARRALAEAMAVDEVQEIRNQAEAWRAYAQQAKDRDMEIAATHIRFRAERRLGELIIAQKESVGLNRGRAGAGRPVLGDSGAELPKTDDRPTLKEAGIDPKLSMRAQRVAGLAPDRFEALLERHREEVNEGNNKVSVDLLRTSAEADGRDKRRALAEALSDASAALPTGRKFPCVYADPPWHRKQGVTNRSYENHYPTMSWDEICAMPVADLLLPDAWVFLWIPRAHLLALHDVEMEFADDSGCVITRKVKLPLAWAVARAWGCDAYSTCYIWTKTDEEHPADQGGGVLVYDQDEILLQFRRGRGLPKPATDEKFKSNHRERKREHSRKPDHYRDMIRTMTGGVPVLELFARVDAEHPLPPDWEASGNQAQLASLAPVAVDDSEPVAERAHPDDAASHPAPQAADSPPSEEGIVSQQVEPLALDTPDAAVPPAERPGSNSSEPDVIPADEPAFPPTEWLDLHAISDRLDREHVAAIAPGYAVRGLAVEIAAGYWSLTQAGQIRIEVLRRERGETSERFKARLDADLFQQWCGLRAIAAGEPLDGEIVRALVGEDYAWATTTRLLLTDGGKQRLAELEAAVDHAAPLLGAAAPPAPKQLDLVDMLGAL